MAHKVPMRSAPRWFARGGEASEITEFNYGKAVWGNDFSSGVGLPRKLARFAELNQVVEIQGAN